MNFLTEEDRRDFFEYIKEINPKLDMPNKDVQDLLNYIEAKFMIINQDIWEKTITVSISGSKSTDKTAMIKKIIQTTIPGFIIVEVNIDENYIRYSKIIAPESKKEEKNGNISFTKY